MKEIECGLFVGNQSDFENEVYKQHLGVYQEPYEPKYSFLLAAKEPWHRNALGYTGRAATKDDPEYLMAKRDNTLILNLVDAPKSEFFNKNIIDAGLEFISEERSKPRNVLICCNEGKSRSASIGLLYLIKHGFIKGETLEDCEAEFLKLYPEYNPGAGMRGFVKENFDVYRNGK